MGSSLWVKDKNPQCTPDPLLFWKSDFYYFNLLDSLKLTITDVTDQFSQIKNVFVAWGGNTVTSPTCYMYSATSSINLVVALKHIVRPCVKKAGRVCIFLMCSYGPSFLCQWGLGLET